MSDNVDVRSEQELNHALALAQYTVYKKYLNDLSGYPLVKPDKVFLDEEPKQCLRAFQLEQLTYKKGEDPLQKLSTVYHASMSLGCSLFVMIDVEKPNAPAKIYLGIRNEGTRGMRPLAISYNALQQGLQSNFPGTRLHNLSAQDQLQKQINDIFGSNTKCVASASCVAALRRKEKTEHKAFIQGLERLIDAMRGHTYTAIFIADPISAQQQSEIRQGYETLYSTLSSFQKSVWSYQESESKAVMESLSEGMAKAVTEGTSHTQSYTTAQTAGTANTFGVGVNIGGQIGSNESVTSSSSRTSPTMVSRVGAAASVIGASASAAAAKLAPIGLIYPPAGAVLGTLGVGAKVLGALGVGAKALEVMGAASQGSSVTQGIANTVGKSLGLSGGLSLNASHTSMNSMTESNTSSDTTNRSTTDTTSKTKTTGETDTTGTGRTLQIENINKPITEMLERIEEQLKRVQEGEDYGSYCCGAYFLSSKPESSLLAANTYRALMVGEGSSVESSAINCWTDEDVVKTMKEYLRRFAQPVFALPLKEKTETFGDVMPYTAGTVVSGLELPLHIGLPTKSVIGLPVIEHAEFGRNVHPTEWGITLGTLYHMGQAEKDQSVDLSVDSLASHTFVTGSTGSGKSNTIYHLLDQLDQKEVRFLVIEPAKGEYKEIFGGRKDVFVYGTNARKAPLLRLNPFSFPEDTHVLEHIDRLVEIFNACWPMYAAMPAVLKAAVERAYRSCGWSLVSSVCSGERRKFPTFQDVVRALPAVVNSKGFSNDTQSDYKGALLTRLESLTNGINGQVLCAYDELESSELFDRNVIVDLSRVGSTETKALLMGVLILKLQEYRMAQRASGANCPNGGLRHITVLEEAHNLLRRTSTEQNQESSNLQGKSVEMLTNAIAEMRTYGEGFIIADQAPGLLDAAVIRNTNTKIILRLPDEQDRVLVGRAAGLNDDQIVELSRLETGVAAVYQNQWLEPVLCMVPEFKKENWRSLSYQTLVSVADPLSEELCKVLLSNTPGERLNEAEKVEQIKGWIARQETGREIKKLLYQVLVEQKPLPEKKNEYVLYCLVRGKHLLNEVHCSALDLEEARAMVDRQIMEALSVSGIIARAIRSVISFYAADSVRNVDEEQYHELCQMGSVQ